MLNKPFAVSVVLALSVALAGCGSKTPRAKSREAWRAQAEAACLKSGLRGASAVVRSIRPIAGPGSCGARHPLLASAVGRDRAMLDPPATLACPMVPAVEGWMDRTVQPTALALFGEPVVGVDVAASYGCRTRNNVRGAKMSEHSYANALDVSTFRFASGRTITVKHGWRGEADERMFLRSVHSGACREFRTIIGPDGDRYHHDHLHLDLARHGRKGTGTYCK